MKYSVLICDDEPLVCDLICNIVDWEELSCNIVDVAHDGQTALKIIKDKKPDIVVTDIRMPIINGLDLIRQVKAMNIETVFVVISGYKNFEYAYEAINYGVSNYLLKPVQKRELEKTIGRIISEREQDEQIRNRINDYNVVLREQFLQSLSKNNIENLSVESLNKNYNLGLREGYFQFLLIQLDCRDIGNSIKRSVSDAKLDLVVAMAENIIQDYYSEFGYCRVMKSGYGQFAVLLNYNEEEKYNKSFSQKLFKKCKERLNSSEYYFTVAMGNVADNSLALHEAYISAQTAMKTRLSGRYNQLIIYSEDDEICPLDHIVTKDQWNEFYQSLELLDESLLEKYLLFYMDLLNDKSKKYPLILYNGIEILLKRFEDKCEKLSIASEDNSTRYYRISDWNFSMGDIRGMERKIREYMVGAITAYKQSKQNADIIPVEKAKEYIALHIRDTVSLDAVAEYVRLNPIYLSSLFKKRTGINYLHM